MSNLEVPHKRFHSRSGDDSDENLIALCFTCHASVHGQTGQLVHGRYALTGKDILCEKNLHEVSAPFVEALYHRRAIIRN